MAASGQYTVSSTAVGTRLQITVRRVLGKNGAPNGRVSTYLHDLANAGDILEVSAPAGDFVVTPSDSPLLLASAGAGITTVLPIVEHIVRTQPRRPVIAADADRTAQDHALRQTVQRMGHQLDNFISYTWYEHLDPADTSSRPGHMDLSDIPLPDDLHVFTCGPLAFMRHVRSELMQRGVPAHHIRYEVSVRHSGRLRETAPIPSSNTAMAAHRPNLRHYRRQLGADAATARPALPRKRTLPADRPVAGLRA